VGVSGELGPRTRAFFGAALAAGLWLAGAVTLHAQFVSEERVQAAIDDASRGLGQALAGGSPLTGPAATTGGLGHFQIGVAGSLTRIEIEDPSREEGTLEFLAPVGSLQGAVGILDGGPLGFGAVDLLGRVGPVVAREDFDEGATLYAVGARVGILGGSATMPAVSATVSRSWVDGLEWGDPEGDEVSFTGGVSTTSLRLDVSKGFLLVTPYAGVGVDRTAIEADYRIPTALGATKGSTDASSVHQKAYAGIDLALLLARATVEVGVYDGGVFGAVGVRVGL